MTNNASRYTKTAVILHWLIAIAILGMFALGWYMTDLPKEGPKQMAYDLFDWGIYTWQLNEEASPRTFYFNLHKSIGITLFGLIIIRILWRITHKPPALLATYKAWERKLATGTHHLLYLLMIAMPLSGLITAVSSKYGVKWFGLPFIKGLDDAGLRDIFKEAHEIIAIIILVALFLHIAGALKHKLIDKDDTLKRMSL
ncbi:cytochrome b [Methylotenera versatilis]|uniref:cytochrome b n=1 Tax=Methylotenera versatilis TaxID=1055487 RepID=UPI00064671D3|nr:cytochrome b [Methylotenera versatilis]